MSRPFQTPREVALSIYYWLARTRLTYVSRSEMQNRMRHAMDGVRFTKAIALLQECGTLTPISDEERRAYSRGAWKVRAASQHYRFNPEARP